MPYFPLATEVGARYELTGPDGSIAVFNDPTSPDYVGMLTNVSGLDGAEVRESASDLVEADGGAHGSFYMGRRPITLEAKIFGHATVLARNIRVDRARRASLALRGDANLAWSNRVSTLVSGVPTESTINVFVPVRRNQPFRESGGWVKDIQMSLVSEYSFIFGTAVKTRVTAVATENQGNVPAYPLLNITGISVDPTASDGTRTFRTTGLSLAAGETVQFDMLNHTGVFTAGARAGQSANRYINFSTTQWLALPGLGTTQTFSVSAGSMTISYRDTWA